MSRSKAPQGFDDIHRILGVAMRAADPATWPARPHLHGPLPVLSTRRQVDIALVVCTHVRPFAAPDELAYVDRMCALAEEVAGLPSGGRYNRSDHRHREQLDVTSRAAKRDGVVQRVAKLTVRAAMNHRYASPSARNVIGTCVENAAVAVVQRLAGDAAPFLAAVDAAIVRSELDALLADRGFEPTSPIARVLSRPRARTGKALGLVFAELADGRFGLHVKLKQRWDWHEGDRATMFATVPDAYMERVIEDIDPPAALRRTGRRTRG